MAFIHCLDKIVLFLFLQKIGTIALEIVILLLALVLYEYTFCGLVQSVILSLKVSDLERYNSQTSKQQNEREERNDYQLCMSRARKKGREKARRALPQCIRTAIINE